ncbi:MAG TPA: hypothetical protein VFP94_04210, partial [Terriglobales bacterium]|nr:hypothetical protein [Terriglobales bacterium]
MRRFAAILCLLAFAGAVSLQAQYFGQNKVRHQQLDFKVLKTQHFDIYYYPSEQAATEEVGRMAERWNDRLSHLLHHVLSTRQPLILYASHTDFEQTNVLPGLIDAATGGVTLATGRKVVLPLAGSLRETDHVLGHELVHAFQYDMTTSRGSQVPGIARLPLWFVEGMAEYLSLGPEDPNTAMWMRDVVAHDKMPTIRDLNNPNKYFPYRFGQAFWAYVGGRYGDDVIAPLLLRASDSGNVNVALQSVLHVDEKQLSADWKAATLAADQPVLQVTAAVPASSLVITAKKDEARLNVSPAVSP